MRRLLTRSQTGNSRCRALVVASTVATSLALYCWSLEPWLLTPAGNQQDALRRRVVLGKQLFPPVVENASHGPRRCFDTGLQQRVL